MKDIIFTDTPKSATDEFEKSLDRVVEKMTIIRSKKTYSLSKITPPNEKSYSPVVDLTQYRVLSPNERLLQSDECFNPHAKDWVKTRCFGSSAGNLTLYRRRHNIYE